MEEGAGRKKLLLHLCCAPCSPHPLNVLEKDFDITLFFYNPNIHPKVEYVERLEEVKKLAGLKKLPLIQDEYRPDLWMKRLGHLKEEPEKGGRCEMCIEERLAKTAQRAAEMGIGGFGTVLSVSPHKDAVMINRAGIRAQSLAKDGVVFYEANFKKKDGFKISSKISRELGFSRQDYCGCVFSMDRGKKGQNARPASM